jgi:hypothetical protein
VALLTCHVHFRDVTAMLTREKVFTCDNFQWQM